MWIECRSGYYTALSQEPDDPSTVTSQTPRRSLGCRFRGRVRVKVRVRVKIRVRGRVRVRIEGRGFG